MDLINSYVRNFGFGDCNVTEYIVQKDKQSSYFPVYVAKPSKGEFSEQEEELTRKHYRDNDPRPITVVFQWA